HFVILDQLPKNQAGKIDRRSLLQIQSEPGPAHVPERALTPGFEQQLAEIWSRVLGARSVGCNDNFFDLGGDSILGLQVAALARECGIAITPKQVFENPTVAALAASASGTTATAAEEMLITGPLPLTPIQRWFFERSFNNAHHWNMAVILDL